MGVLTKLYTEIALEYSLSSEGKLFQDGDNLSRAGSQIPTIYGHGEQIEKEVSEFNGTA